MNKIKFTNTKQIILAALLTSCGQSALKPMKPYHDAVGTNLIVHKLPGLPTELSSGGNGGVTETSGDSTLQNALQNADLRNIERASSPASNHVSGEITLKKSRLLNRTFLYGVDLQYSSGVNPEYDLIDQTMAMGHVPVTFQILGDKLQLLTDSRRLFESNINHPETLVAEYRILTEDSNSITVTIDRPGVLIHKTMNGKDSAPPTGSWIRSLSYDENGDYLLQESALMLADGRVQTFMESVFPRDSLVPDGYRGVENNSDVNPFAERFMLLDNEKVFVERRLENGVPVREETKFANRYLLADSSATIDWYVTPNMPDDFMKETRSGVEGWNRYFHDQLGRDVVQFKGRLPDGIKIGDPRYNVVNFDTVGEAGAAYETQASDPMSGIQSHSLIYMPYAWYKIATKLSSARELPLEPANEMGPKSPEVLFGTSRNVIRCLRDARDVATSPIQSKMIAAASDDDAAKLVDDFGRRIFISTLFHEMGHAFGLHHNFKASLSFDGTKPADFSNNPTTYSVMDYNYYQHEVGLMDEIGASNGPRLEYDRQAISYLYNEGRDIKETDKVIPACEDTNADDIEGGIDPDCIRYDAESVPVVGLDHALTRFTNASGARGLETLTLSQSMNSHRDAILTHLSDPSLTPNAEAVTKFATNRATALGKLVGYYVGTGAQSLRVNLTLNAGALRAWRSQPANVATTLTESERRRRYVKILKQSVEMQGLPAVALRKFEVLLAQVSTTITSTGRFGTPEERTALALAVTSKIREAVIEKTSDALADLRFGAAKSLSATKEKGAFASFMVDGLSAEQIAVATLQHISLLGLSAMEMGSSASQHARVGGVTNLATFQSIGDDYEAEIAAVRSQLVVIRNSARQAGKQDIVDHVRELIRALN
jgi:Met-zincin